MPLNRETTDTICFLVDAQLKAMLSTFVRFNNTSVNAWMLEKYGERIAADVVACWNSLPDSIKTGTPERKKKGNSILRLPKASPSSAAE
jgi:hypothetical protein